MSYLKELFNKNWFRLLFVIIILIAIPATVFLAKQVQTLRSRATEPVTPSLHLVPLVVTKQINEEFDVTVSLSAGANNISGVDLSFSYPKDNLNIVNVNAASTFNSEILKERGETTGKFRYVAVNTSKTKQLNGEVDIVTIRFKGKTVGSFDVKFEDVQIVASGNENPLTVTKIGGSYVVTTGSSSTLPSKNTLCFAISDDESALDKVTNCDNLDNELTFAYTDHPTKVSGFTFTDQKPGVKVVFVKFIGVEGITPVTKQRGIRFNPGPSISSVDCTHSPTGPGTTVTITGDNFGSQGRGKVQVKDFDTEITSWNGTTNVINAALDQRLEGRIKATVTADDGKTAEGECVVNTITVAFKTALQCKAAGTFTASNVDVKVFEAIPLTTEDIKPDPILKQKISLNKDGEPEGFAPKFEKKKKYQLIVKVPGTLAKRVDFDTKDGGTVNLNDGSHLILAQGDIAPANAPDGKINAFDKSELIRQWSLVIDVTRTADLNGDSRVNSIDYACMRQNINKEDEGFSPPSPSPSPATSPSPSPSLSPGEI